MQTPNTADQQPTVFTMMIYSTLPLSETITGDFARRHPLNEAAVSEMLSALTLLHLIRCLVFDQTEPDTTPADPMFLGSPFTRGTDVNLRTCTHILIFSRATLVLALHRELARRATEPPAAGAPMGHWAAERLELLRRHAREMAHFTAEEVAATLRFIPSLPHLTQLDRGALVAWAQFCLGEAALERVSVIEAISEALKLVGYSWMLPPGLMERLEAYVNTHRAVAPSVLRRRLDVDGHVSVAAG
ncbi:hypothetical protein DFH09DRAFT_1312881 [Mycena vulgaris]|nr:hypothetical protein DFH09DRAFT_1312881 [Mycena vulgaris]